MYVALSSFGFLPFTCITVLLGTSMERQRVRRGVQSGSRTSSSTAPRRDAARARIRENAAHIGRTSGAAGQAQAGRACAPLSSIDALATCLLVARRTPALEPRSSRTRTLTRTRRSWYRGAQSTSTKLGSSTHPRLPSMLGAWLRATITPFPAPSRPVRGPAHSSAAAAAASAAALSMAACLRYALRTSCASMSLSRPAR